MLGAARMVVLGALVLGGAVRAHDLSADIGLSVSRPTDPDVCAGADAGVCSPRSGGASINVSGAYDFSDAWSAWLGLGYTRDLPTRTREGGSTGGNIFTLSAGAMWMPTARLSFLAGANVFPKSATRIATAIANPSDVAPVFVVIDAQNSSVGVNLAGLYSTDVGRALESTIDASVGLTSFTVFQRADLGTSLRAAVLRSSCRNTPTLSGCQLVNGVEASLLQARLQFGYTGTIQSDLDLGLEGALFFYNRDPTTVGVYSLGAGLDRLSTSGSTGASLDLGAGVPAAPLAFTVRPMLLYRISRLTFRLTYQLGSYVAGLGTSHALALKTTVRIGSALRVSLTLAMSGDRERDVLLAYGASAVLGVLWVM